MHRPIAYRHPRESGGRLRCRSPVAQDAFGYLWTKLCFRTAMDALYRFCVIVAGGALVLISAVIPWGVFTRYVLNSAASWPEPMAILLTIVLTFFGSAACYRAGTHMSVSVLVRVLSPPLRRVIEPFAEGLVALVGLFMVIWGARLVGARPGTSRLPSFPHCRSGSPTCRSRSAAPSPCSSSSSAC